MSSVPTVYVVDDDPGALRSLCWLIQQADLPVRAFRSGREFLESYDRSEPGCLVLDVRMPEMSGLEVQRILAEDGADLPIIFITAHGDVPTCAHALKAGAVEFLEKPLDGEVFLDHVRRALARGGKETAGAGGRARGRHGSAHAFRKGGSGYADFRQEPENDRHPRQRHGPNHLETSAQHPQEDGRRQRRGTCCAGLPNGRTTAPVSGILHGRACKSSGSAPARDRLPQSEGARTDPAAQNRQAGLP